MSESDHSGDSTYRGTCSDCGWSYGPERETWVRMAAQNHEAVYRNVEGHETAVREVQAGVEQ